MHGEHGHIRALLDRRRQTDCREVRAVSCVDEQQLSVCAAQVGEGRKVAPQAVVGGRGEQDGADVGMGEQLTLGVLDAQRTRNAERFEQGRGEEIRRDVEQGAAVADRAVHLAVDEHAAAAADRRAEHGEDALRRAAGEEKAVVRAEITRRRDLCVADRAVAEVEIARAVGLGVVDGKNIAERVKNRLSLVAGHMEARRIRGGEQLKRVEKRRAGKRHQPVDGMMLAAVQGCTAGRHFSMVHEGWLLTIIYKYCLSDKRSLRNEAAARQRA